MTIDRVGGGITPQSTLDPGTLLQQSLAGSKEVDPSKLLAELLKSLEVMQGTGSKGSVDPRPGPAGAPGLEAPMTDFSADQLSIILAQLNTKSQDAQIKTAKEGLEISKVQKEEMHKKAIEKIEEAARKAAEAAAKN